MGTDLGEPRGWDETGRGGSPEGEAESREPRAQPGALPASGVQAGAGQWDSGRGGGWAPAPSDLVLGSRDPVWEAGGSHTSFFCPPPPKQTFLPKLEIVY